MGKVAKPATKNNIGSLTDRMRMFAAEYVIDFDGKSAAIRAGYSERSADKQAALLLARKDIGEIIRAKMVRMERSCEIKAEKVLEEAWGIATADVNDLVEFRRRCCRHCYGIDYGYQRTVAQMSRDRLEYENKKRAFLAKFPMRANTYEDFDEKGGIGYDARLPPNPDCQECWGDGVGDAFFKPTGDLTPAARALYAGVKQTKDGYQMLTIDKLGALEKLFKHKGLYKVDNEQKADAFTEFLAAVHERGGKLPIKEG